ncbi:hypothetical protein [Mycolicibacterium aubagnense]|uniref:hypothetical protein n=1 Tax=Mycolicibacterium aubagnense TaxID=319707 RepID=UPI0010FE2EDA|nr:hypothetical protein [Mycolicibacterium aubagnense]TLH70702.1 hypothetical protein C1S80_00060 [Mycolicibacterium aubagnense]WGI32797.1 hypothetical protein QDT91_27230 [Mycolicibacterium aubagnense]
MYLTESTSHCWPLTPNRQLEEGLSLLVIDLNTGAWALKYSHLQDLPELDLGYRLLVAELD